MGRGGRPPLPLWLESVERERGGGRPASTEKERAGGRCGAPPPSPAAEAPAEEEGGMEFLRRVEEVGALAPKEGESQAG